MPSPFDMITHSPIMQLANLARAGQNPMGLIQQLSGQNAPIMQGLNLIQGKNEAQLRTMAQNLAKERGIDLNQLASALNLTLPREPKRNASQFCGLDKNRICLASPIAYGGGMA